MDILDILLDILLKPPQPLMGLFLLHTVINHQIQLTVVGSHPVWLKTQIQQYYP